MTIKATIIASSVSEYNPEHRITTFELEYPDIIHSHLLTHRLLSRNTSSSRAVPVSTMNNLIKENTAYPTRFGKNKVGMQDDGEHNQLIDFFGEQFTPYELWDVARDLMIDISDSFNQAGYHKQICNRLTEVFSYKKVLVTATEWDNFFYLRVADDADPTIAELASKMLEQYKRVLKGDLRTNSLKKGEWHLPYYKDGFWTPDMEDSFETAIKISSACCARISYRKEGEMNLETANSIWKKLYNGDKLHGSAFEHQATPIVFEALDGTITDTRNWPEGVSHMDQNGSFWSGNLKGWIQNRKLINNESCQDYDYAI